jgi:thiamine-phosphate pyrophosphorylase
MKEGLRVCEDIIRFVIDDRQLCLKFKKIRHSLFLVLNILVRPQTLLEARNTVKDVGKKTIPPERKRKNYQQIFFANIQRVKESLRVLEEFSKVLQKKQADRLKIIRYQIYTLEKEANKKLLAVKHQ